jgi:hypothetical protein
MTNSVFQKLTIASASIALSFAVVKVSPAQAAVITYDFTTDLVSGFLSASALEFGLPFDQQPISGFFSYDDSALVGVGLEVLGEAEGLTAYLRRPFLVGGGLGLVQGIGVPRLPLAASFRDGELLGLGAVFITAGSSFPGRFPINFEGIEIDGQQVRNIYRFQRSFSSTVYEADVYGNVQYSLRTIDSTSVAEPNTVLGTCIFGIVSLLKLLKKENLSE